MQKWNLRADTGAEPEAAVAGTLLTVAADAFETELGGWLINGTVEKPESSSSVGWRDGGRP